jgi:hypothetical protein
VTFVLRVFMLDLLHQMLRLIAVATLNSIAVIDVATAAASAPMIANFSAMLALWRAARSKTFLRLEGIPDEVVTRALVGVWTVF